MARGLKKVKTIAKGNPKREKGEWGIAKRVAGQYQADESVQLVNEGEGEEEFEEVSVPDDLVKDPTYKDAKPRGLILRPISQKQKDNAKAAWNTASTIPTDRNMPVYATYSRSTKTNIILFDVEVHKMNGTICQLAAIRLSDGDLFNEYVFHKPLAEDWQWLIKNRGVRLDPWDDPRVAHSFDYVFLRFLQWLPESDDQDTLNMILYKGSGDNLKIKATLELFKDHPSHSAPGIIQLLQKKNVKVAKVDILWESLRPMLPPGLMNLVMASTNLGRTLALIYDNLFWKPILVYIEPNLTSPDQVVDYDLPAPLSFHTKPITHDTQAEFLQNSHHQPAWHTAHTDAIFTREVTVFMLYVAQFWVPFMNVITDQIEQHFDREIHSDVNLEEVLIQTLATKVVRQTCWFRKTHLQPTDQAMVVANTIAVIMETKAESLIHSLQQSLQIPDEELPPLEPPPEDLDDDPAPLVPSSAKPVNPNPDNAGTVQKTRKQRLNGPIMPMLHNGEIVDIYIPFKRGQDALKVRALKNMTGAETLARHKIGPQFGSSIDRMEVKRWKLGLPPIGMRPWYYYPKATGKHQPGVQILHVRDCRDRKNGKEFGKEPEWENDGMAYYDFDLGMAPGDYILAFCKECKRYKETTVLDPDSPKADSPSSLLLLLYLLCNG